MLGYYLLVIKMGRHTCYKCKSKRDIKYLDCKLNYGHYGKRIYWCNDQYCGEAWVNKHMQGSRVSKTPEKRTSLD